MSLYPAMLAPTGTDAAVLTELPREQAATQATECVAVCARGFYWCLRAVARIPEGGVPWQNNCSASWLSFERKWTGWGVSRRLRKKLTGGFLHQSLGILVKEWETQVLLFSVLPDAGNDTERKRWIQLINTCLQHSCHQQNFGGFDLGIVYACNTILPVAWQDSPWSSKGKKYFC